MTFPDVVPDCTHYPCEQLLYTDENDPCVECNKNGCWHIKGENEYPIDLELKE